MTIRELSERIAIAGPMVISNVDARTLLGNLYPLASMKEYEIGHGIAVYRSAVTGRYYVKQMEVPNESR